MNKINIGVSFPILQTEIQKSARQWIELAKPKLEGKPFLFISDDIDFMKRVFFHYPVFM